MTKDADFEKELFAMYGEPSAAWPDAGVTHRVIARVHREQRVRTAILSLAAIFGAVMALFAIGMFAPDAISRAVSTIEVKPLAFWVLCAALAVVAGGAVAREA